jgi:hypothetical protein
LYAPPEYKADQTVESMRAASAEYSEFFFDCMPVRQEALRAFFASFDVALSTDDIGVAAVSAWMPEWADLLVNASDDGHPYARLEVPWAGKLRGLNVIFDLGFYYGECLWVRRTKLKWRAHRGPDANGNLWTWHLIDGLDLSGRPFDPFHFAFGKCWDVRHAKMLVQKGWPGATQSLSLRGDVFSRYLRAHAPPGRRSRKSGQIDRTQVKE